MENYLGIFWLCYEKGNIGYWYNSVLSPRDEYSLGNMECKDWSIMTPEIVLST